MELYFDFREYATRDSLLEQLYRLFSPKQQNYVNNAMRLVELNKQHYASWDEIVRCVNSLSLDETVRRDVRSVYYILAQAEAKIHKTSVEKAHFHEVGRARGIKNVIHVCLCFNVLQPKRVISTPIQLGCGTVNCSHGILSIPAPATAAIIGGSIPVCDKRLEGERCTPTSAALIRHFVGEFDVLNQNEQKSVIFSEQPEQLQAKEEKQQHANNSQPADSKQHTNNSQHADSKQHADNLQYADNKQHADNLQYADNKQQDFFAKSLKDKSGLKHGAGKNCLENNGNHYPTECSSMTNYKVYLKAKNKVSCKAKIKSLRKAKNKASYKVNNMASNEQLQKLHMLKRSLSHYSSVAVAFSGGVDSSFLLAVAHEVLGDHSFAVMAESELLSQEEIKRARAFCKEQKIVLIKVPFDILTQPGFRENTEKRCYVCKQHMFAILQNAVNSYAAQHDLGEACLIEGSNTSDKKDTRPGFKAAKEAKIASPLLQSGLSKGDVRALSRVLCLSFADKQSSACLASRIAYGQAITPHLLRKIEKAEQKLHSLGFSHVRVRVHDQGRLARIELSPSELECAMSVFCKDTAQFYKYITKAMHNCGFSFSCIDTAGYQRGSTNKNFPKGINNLKDKVF